MYFHDIIKNANVNNLITDSKNANTITPDSVQTNTISIFLQTGDDM